MKTIPFFKPFTLLCVMLFVLSCVQNDEYEVPIAVIESVDIPNSQVLEILGIRSLLDQEIEVTGDPNTTLTFTTDNDESNDRYIVGYVISNDFSGNFFEELILQNKAVQPTTGVKILIDVNPLSATYELGRKLFVKLDGLTVGYDSGVLALGTQEVNRVGKISEAAQKNFLFRDDEVEEIIPLPISIDQFTDVLTNTYVALEGVQFNRNDYLKTFAGEPLDEFDGERMLEACNSGATPSFNIRTTFSTSTFANFKGVALPAGMGSMAAILTKDFYGEVFNLVINDPTSINFDSTERCDPEVLGCSSEVDERKITVYSENFQQFDSIEDYVNIGWTNININNGSEIWELDGFSNNQYARVSGFGSEEIGIDSWLITPAINIGTNTEEELNFQIQAAYDNGIGLSVLISNNFLGDVSTANWQVLDVTMPIGPVDGFGDFVQVAPIDLSCINGIINIAFRYEGSDPGITTRYHVDALVIKGN